ncbi:MAG: DUF4270 family protein [Bacteroidia bacterium]
MNNTKKFKILQAVSAAKFFLILATGIFLASCNKPTDIGLDVQPTNDKLNVSIDSTILITKTVREDSLRTDQFGIVATGLIGKYFDPIFGEVTSSLYTKLTLLTPRTFDTIPTCDSVVLSLVYTGDAYPKAIKGKQTLNVFQLTQDIQTGNSYFSQSTIPFQTNDLTGGFLFTANLKDSIKIKGQKLKPQLRVTLNKKFGEDILNSGKLTNNTDFQSFLKGLYITTENTTGLSSGDGNIPNFSLGESQLLIYHHRLNSKDSVLYIGIGDLRFSHFNHAFASTASPDINLQLNSTTQTQNDYTYIQSMAGVKTRIEIPNIMELNIHKPLGINRAELVIKIAQESLKGFVNLPLPGSLSLYGITDDGKSYILPDAYESSAYYAGIYDTAKAEYRFNIVRYTQKVLNGELKNNGLFLVASSAVTNANRLIIGGGGVSAGSVNPYQMKFYITYTK